MLVRQMSVVEEMRDDAVRPVEVERVERAATSQHPPRLTERLLLHVQREVVKHEGREHPVERCLRVRQLVRENAIESHRKASLLRFSPCACERVGIRIEAHDLRSRMETLDEEREVPGPAADVEDVVSRLDVRLIDELPVRRLGPDQLAEDVVQGEQPVVGRCRNIGPLPFACSSAHGHFLVVNHSYMNRRGWTAACVDLQAPRSSCCRERQPGMKQEAGDTVVYPLTPIGVIRSTLRTRPEAPKQGCEGAPDAWLEIAPAVARGLRGIAAGEEIIVITWLHRARRDVLEVHPRWDKRLPLTGVFATRSPDRPNPLGLHRVRVVEIAGNRLKVGPMEAIDGTPVIDVKPVLPGGADS